MEDGDVVWMGKLMNVAAPSGRKPWVSEVRDTQGAAPIP